MDELYEIHISVDLRNGIDEMQWIWLCKDNGWHNIRVINSTGKHNIQYMMSKWCSRTTPEGAIERAKALEQIVIDAGLTPVRTKVEALQGNSHCGLYLPNGDKKRGCYWEFHIKVEINSGDDLERLTNTIFSGYDIECVNISMSSSSQKNFPIVTLRLYSGSLEEAVQKKNVLIAGIKNCLFSIHKKVQHELSIYDTNPDLDEGWL